MANSFYCFLLVLLKTRKGLWDYLRIKVKHLYCFVTGENFTEESFEGMEFSFFNYFQFVALLEHRFIRNEYLFKAESKTPKIIDCGANIGDSVLYFKYLYPEAEILAFEPDKETFTVLEKNVKANNLLGVKLKNLAVYDKEERLKFYRDSFNPGVGIMSLYKERLPHEFKIVKTAVLSKYIKGRVDLVKLDIEGAEGPVIKELDESKKLGNIKLLIIEYHHHIGGRKNRLADILTRLAKNGFDYQLSTELRPPFVEGIFQDIIIYAYRSVDLEGVDPSTCPT